MSVTECKLMRSTRSGSADLEYKREYTVQWRVTTDDPTDGWTTVLLQSGNSGLTDPVPDLWDTFSFSGDIDTGVYLQNKSGQVGDSEKTWIVTGTWRAPAPGKDPDNGDNQPNPLLRPSRFRLEWANYSRIVEYDIFGELIANSAGQQFDPPIEQDDARPVLVLETNVANLSIVINTARGYKNVVNTDLFLGAPPRTAKIESVTSGQMMTENEINYYTLVMRIQFNDVQWDRVLVDQGFSHYDTASNKRLLRAREGEQNEDGTYKKSDAPALGEPVGLSADGTRLPKGQPMLEKTPGFRTYREKPFAPLLSL